jgi:hypothetical protein
VPCETQERPDLRTNPAAPPQPSFRVRDAPAAAEARARSRAVDWLRDESKALGQTVKVVDEVLEAADLPRIDQLGKAAGAVSGAGAGKAGGR